MKTTDKKTFVLLNPAAGRSEQGKVPQKMRQVLLDHQVSFEIHETTRDDDLQKIVASAHQRGFERFLAVGGDGTVSGVASGLAETDKPVVIIPTGTANAFAKILSIPLQIEQALDWWLSTQRTKAVDAMKIGDRYFILNISVGVSSLALVDVKRQEKRLYGPLAYWLKGLQKLLGISPYKYQFSIDGLFYQHRASELVVANSGIIQFEPLRLNPEIQLDDGKLSVCHIRANNLLDYLRIAAGMISGQPTERHELTCRDAYEKIRIQTERPLPIQADGEIIGTTPVSIQVVPAAVRFLIPEAASLPGE